MNSWWFEVYLIAEPGSVKVLESTIMALYHHLRAERKAHVITRSIGRMLFVQCLNDDDGLQKIALKSEINSFLKSFQRLTDYEIFLCNLIQLKDPA